VHVSVSTRAVSRLSLYRSALSRFQTYGAVKIYSCDLAKTLGFTAAQVRKDFSQFKFAGKKKVGYDVNGLIKNIDHLLQKNHITGAVLCGAGKNGSALLIGQLLDAPGVSIIAAFDDHEPAGGSAGIIPVQPIEKMIGFVVENGIRFGIISTSAKDAQRMADTLVMAGISGILNLSGTPIKTPKQCIVNTVNILQEFEKLVYFVNNAPTAAGKRGN